MPFIALGPCYRCREIFPFNADLVPSIIVDGIRRPLCKRCVLAVNEIRKTKETPLIDPLPGAYEPEEN